jgi:hypothetical protein
MVCCREAAILSDVSGTIHGGALMSAGSDDQPVDVADTDEQGGQNPGGTGGTLFKRMTSGEPQDRGVRRWAFASGGALVALVAAGLGVRQWRRRG